MPEPYSEAETRRDRIDANLRLAGWNVADSSQVIQELDIYVEEGKRGAIGERPPREFAGHQFADYALMLRGKPAAVVEAKKTSRDARLGQEQAKQYAEKLAQIHKTALPFVLYTNGNDTFYWDSEQYPPAKVVGFPTQLDLEWLVAREGSPRCVPRHHLSVSENRFGTHSKVNLLRCEGAGP